MNSDTDNRIQSAIATGPRHEGVVPSLGRPAPTPAKGVTTRRSVMETLLGQNQLAALDGSGGDPYNATGRQFRR